MDQSILVIACGALAREIQALKLANGWTHMKIQCIDAHLHFYPQKIPDRLRHQLDKARGKFDKVFVAYGDCGTGGEIDRIIEQEEGVERVPGPHCYSFFAGEERFEQLSEEEPGTFYLTDFLVRHFKRLVITSLKIDQHPELKDQYFGNYKKLIYLSQLPTETLMRQAQEAADFLGLAFEHVHCGYGSLETSINSQVQPRA